MSPKLNVHGMFHLDDLEPVGTETVGIGGGSGVKNRGIWLDFRKAFFGTVVSAQRPSASALDGDPRREAARDLKPLVLVHEFREYVPEILC